MPDELLGDGAVIFVFIGVMVVAEWIQREKPHAAALNGLRMPTIVRWGLYYGIAFTIFWFKGDQQEFIYFQF